MKKPLITRITNKTGSPLIMDVAPGFPRIYVGAHKTVDYPGDIFTVMSEPACRSILKLDPEKVIIKYLVGCGKDHGYEPVYSPTDCAFTSIGSLFKRLLKMSEDKAREFVSKSLCFLDSSKAEKDLGFIYRPGVKDTDPKVVKDIIEKAEEVFVEKPAEVSIEPSKEPVQEAPVEEAPAVEDFFTTTVEDTTEDTKKTAKKRKAK